MDAERMARWWGPHGFANLVCEVDARPGGAWRVEQRAPDGSLHRFSGVYREVVRPTRLVHTFVWEGPPSEEILVTATFTEHDGKTTITSASRFDARADRDGMLWSGEPRGGWSRASSASPACLQRSEADEHAAPADTESEPAQLLIELRKTPLEMLLRGLERRLPLARSRRGTVATVRSGGSPGLFSPGMPRPRRRAVSPAAVMMPSAMWTHGASPPPPFTPHAASCVPDVADPEAASGLARHHRIAAAG